MQNIERPEDDAAIIARFRERLVAEWLPAYANDPKRCYGVEAFRHSYDVSAHDAFWFMQALDLNVARSDAGGRLRAPRSEADEVIFWECGPKHVRPRPINLWREPVITVAALAKLNVVYGWPGSHLGMQSKDWAFDLVAYRNASGPAVLVAGEVKKSARELAELVELMSVACTDPAARAWVEVQSINAYKKWQSLGRLGAPIFWAIGPGGLSRVYQVQYDNGLPISIVEIGEERLCFA